MSKILANENEAQGGRHAIGEYGLVVGWVCLEISGGGGQDDSWEEGLCYDKVEVSQQCFFTARGFFPAAGSRTSPPPERAYQGYAAIASLPRPMQQ